MQNTKSSLRVKYTSVIKPNLTEKFNIKNDHLVPKLTKIVIASGVGKASQDAKYLNTVLATLTKISGQKPVSTKAKKSIAGFKLRENLEIGAKVTLRGENMYMFMEKLATSVLPRIRDFRGLNPKAFDGQANYSIGLKEQSIFPEISYEESANAHGLQINFVFNINNKEQARALLEGLGLVFEGKKK